MSATTPVPSTTIAPSPAFVQKQIPTSLWVIITGDPYHKNQKYERVHISGNVQTDGLDHWDSTKPMYFGDGEPHSNLGDSLTFDKTYNHDDAMEEYRGIWQLTAMPYRTSWWGNFFRKDLSASPNNDTWDPVGVYTGINPWYDGPPDYTIDPPEKADLTYAEVLHCGDCFDPTGYVNVNMCGGDFNHREGCSTYVVESWGKFCGLGQLWPRDMALKNLEDDSIIPLKYAGGDYSPPGWDMHDLINEVGCELNEEQGGKRCPTKYCAEWTGHLIVEDLLGDQTWEITISADGLGEDSEGDLCAYGGWDITSRMIASEGSWEQDGHATLCCGQNGIGTGPVPYGTALVSCCIDDAEVNLTYPDLDLQIQLGGGTKGVCPESENSYSSILGYNVAFDMDGFGVGCDCCRPCKRKKDKEEVEETHCMGGIMGVTLVDDPTTTMGPTTTTNEPPTTAAPGTTTTAAPGPTTTTSAPGPTTTTTPDPSRYICVSNGTTWSNGTYEKASSQYNGKDQWSKTDGAETRWVYYHSATYGWSITASNKGNNGFQSADDSDAENPWDVDSSAWTPAVGLNIAIDEC